MAKALTFTLKLFIQGNKPVKCLGIYLDQILTWKAWTTHVCSKSSSHLFIEQHYQRTTQAM